jgi:broad specificity phosphatase PhoE
MEGGGPNKVIQLTLVRHGESLWQAEDRYAGSTDVPLSPRGREQAEQLANWSSFARLTAIWSSPLSRTRETAAPVERITGLKAHIDFRLKEIDFGRGEGLTAAEIEQSFPEAFAAFQSDPVVHYLPGGEDPHRATQRVLACFKEMESKHPGGRVLVVSHSTLIRLALCELIGVPLSTYRSLFPSINNAALTEILLAGETTSLLRFNVPLNFLVQGVPDDPEAGIRLKVKS